MEQFDTNFNKTASLTSNLGNKTVQNKGMTLQDNRPSFILQKKANNTGLPDNLKSGIENLSGHAMDDVKVHYNSDKPAQLNAHAYAQGTDIHLASGQEKHLPHEAWHVVQQKQGRVKPTMQMKGKVNINDDTGLEKEADVMGEKAINTIQQKKMPLASSLSSSKNHVQLQTILTHSFYTPKFDSQVLQRQIEYNTTKKTYQTNSTRPGWRKLAEDALLDEYNIRHDVTKEKLEYAKLKLDRCHIVSFEDIQSQMASYLNGGIDASSFENFITIITAHLPSSGSEKTGINQDWKSLIAEVKSGDVDSIVSSANSLLSRLNSISDNLRAGNKYLNSYIQQNLDLFFQKTDSGKYQLTDHSRTVLTKGSSFVSSVLRTPEHKSRLVTSEGPISFGNLTPRSKQLTESHPFETRHAKSKNVRDPLYGSKPSIIPVKGYKKTQPVVNPLILKLQPQIDWNKLELVKLRKQESNLRLDLDNLLKNSKTAFDYHELLKSKQILSQQYGNMFNELQKINIDLNSLIPQYHLNDKKINTLNEEKNTVQTNIKKTNNVTNYEWHEQNINYQLSLHQSGQTADSASYYKSLDETNRLSKEKEVSEFLNQRQQINTLDIQIYHLQNENNRIASIYQYMQNLKNNLNDLEKKLENITNYILYLESNQDVNSYKQLLTNLNLTLGVIRNTEQEIYQLQQELSKIIF